MTRRVLVLSEVTAADAPLLTRLIRAGKAHWGYPPEWLDAWSDELTITPEQIAAWHICTASCEGEVVGFFALAHHDGDWWLEHLWLVVDRIGHGFGGELFRLAMAAAAGLGAARVRIEADPNAEGFYLHVGARRDGERISTATGTTRIIPRLVWSLAEHHQAGPSP
jgi:RimJ/RimL family protein N-acetyltransferase